MSVLSDADVRQKFLLAWQESKPGTAAAHEEGGFVLRESDGTLRVERWPLGSQNRITVPEHPDGKRSGLTIVATFHTHPNADAKFFEEPSPTDIRAVRDDPDLAHAEYEGEYVIATESTYLILSSGIVSVVGQTEQLFGHS